MTDIDTIKQLYTPTSTAETQAVISSVSEQEKNQKKETAAFGEILKNVSSLATKIGKDVKSFKLAKEGGFGEGKTFKDFFRWQSTPDYEREPFMEKGLSARLKSDGTPYTVNDLAADGDTSLGSNIIDGKSGGLKSSLTTGVGTSAGVSSDKDYEPKFTLGDLKTDKDYESKFTLGDLKIDQSMRDVLTKEPKKKADNVADMVSKKTNNGADVVKKYSQVDLDNMEKLKSGTFKKYTIDLTSSNEKTNPYGTRISKYEDKTPSNAIDDILLLNRSFDENYELQALEDQLGVTIRDGEIINVETGEPHSMQLVANEMQTLYDMPKMDAVKEILDNPEKWKTILPNYKKSSKQLKKIIDAFNTGAKGGAFSSDYMSGIFNKNINFILNEMGLGTKNMKKERLTDDLSGVRIPIIDNEFYDNWGTGISVIEAAKKISD